MQIVMNIKPRVIKYPSFSMDLNKTVRSTKGMVEVYACNNMHLACLSVGIGFVRSFNGSDKTIRVINYEKRRPVVAEVTDKKLLKKGIKRQVVTPGHWVAHAYDFPIDLLKSAGLKVIQGSRTFKLLKA